MSNSLTYLGLYSGCGGSDSGFTKNGFQSLGAIDINSHALTVHKRNLPGPVFNADLKTCSVFELIGKDKVDIIFSGAPCQGFSTAGMRNVDDPRNSLLLKGGEIALEMNTKVFISENVMGSVAGKHKKYWDELENRFRGQEYKTQFVKVNCLDIGMAQMRKRILFFAWKGGVDQIQWPKKVGSKTLRNVLKNVENCSLNNDGIYLNKTDQKFAIANQIGPNQKLCNVRGGGRAVPTWEIPSVYGDVLQVEKEVLVSMRNLRRKLRVRDFGDADPVHINSLISQHGKHVVKIVDGLIEKGFVRNKGENIYDLTMTFNGKFRRLSWDKPTPTVDTRFGNPIFFLHPDENRGFTVREAARIQGFDDDFIFEGSIGEQFKMIGNAVPPPLSEIIATIAKKQLICK